MSEAAFRAFETRADAARALANELAGVLAAALERRGSAALVVSGGTSPVEMFHQLREHAIDWTNVTVVPSDERDVPPDHPDRNEGMIRRELLQGPAAAARLVSLIPPGEIPERFHAVVLGMGVDGHTASLFPSSPDLQAALESDDALHRLSVPGPEADRVSLTPRALLSSRRIDLLFFGEEKRAVFEQAARPGDPAEFPVRAVLEQDSAPVTVFWAP
jgi:6-phosphogluconolactonase